MAALARLALPGFCARSSQLLYSMERFSEGYWRSNRNSSGLGMGSASLCAPALAAARRDCPNLEQRASLPPELPPYGLAVGGIGRHGRALLAPKKPMKSHQTGQHGMGRNRRIRITKPLLYH